MFKTTIAATFAVVAVTSISNVIAYNAGKQHGQFIGKYQALSSIDFDYIDETKAKKETRCNEDPSSAACKDATAIWRLAKMGIDLRL